MTKNTLKLIIIALLLLVVLIKNPFKIIFVKGNSMFPTYKNNQILLAKKTNDLRKNDVIVVHEEGDIIIKRIKYTEGDYIYYYFDNDKYFLDNDYETIHNFILLDNGLKLYKLKVPKSFYYIVGDNKNESDDSRRFGLVNSRDILYKVID